MLTPERIMALEQQSYVKSHRPVSTEDCWGDEKITYEPTEYFNMFMFARAIEAEVRKQDTELIQQMLEALNTCDESDGYTGLRQFFDEKSVESAITAARKRLENT